MFAPSLHVHVYARMHTSRKCEASPGFCSSPPHVSHDAICAQGHRRRGGSSVRVAASLVAVAARAPWRIVASPASSAARALNGSPLAMAPPPRSLAHHGPRTSPCAPPRAPPIAGRRSRHSIAGLVALCEGSSAPLPAGTPAPVPAPFFPGPGFLRSPAARHTELLWQSACDGGSSWAVAVCGVPHSVCLATEGSCGQRPLAPFGLLSGRMFLGLLGGFVSSCASLSRPTQSLYARAISQVADASEPVTIAVDSATVAPDAPSPTTS